MQYLIEIAIFLTSLFLILLILIQRGRGGGLAGALGGMGGQSAFGTKAGDLFTRITIGVAALWILLSVTAIAVLNKSHSVFGQGGSVFSTGGERSTGPDSSKDGTSAAGMNEPPLEPGAKKDESSAPGDSAVPDSGKSTETTPPAASGLPAEKSTGEKSTDEKASPGAAAAPSAKSDSTPAAAPATPAGTPPTSPENK